MNENDLHEKNYPQNTQRNHPCEGIMRWDSLDSLIFAFTLIWAGVVFLSGNFDPEINAWPLFFIGAGSLVLIEIVIRLIFPAYRTSVTGDLIWAGILFWLSGWNFILPLALVALGIYMLYNSYFQNHVQVDNK
jgi:hypothetical protein